MKVSFPWHKYGLITDIAQHFSDRQAKLGKTALQKIVYLLQELHQLNAGYEYSLHNYGPFSAELQADLDLVESMRGVEVKTLEYGYEINPGPKSASLREKANGFLSKDTESAIKNIIDEFGGLSTKQLELISTVVYADRDTRRSGRDTSRDEIIKLVNEIKPHFSPDKISETLANLESKGFVDIRR